jgi:hypothetical protein
MQKDKTHGTLRKGKDWFLFDQIIISGALLNADESFYTTGPQQTHIFSPDHLRLYDEQQLDYRPRRTYQGPIYKGGASDHFPVYIEFYIND